MRELMFRNCLRLDEEARSDIINYRFAKYVCLPGKKVPLEFTHKATSTYITISQGNFCTASSRFKACVRYDSIKDHTLFSIDCYIRSKEGVIINQVNYLTELNPGQSPQIRTPHLFIIGDNLSHQRNRSCLEVDVDTTEMMFEFTCSGNHIITECGVRILEVEVKKRKRPCFETGDNTNDHVNDENANLKLYATLSTKQIRLQLWRSLKLRRIWKAVNTRVVGVYLESLVYGRTRIWRSSKWKVIICKIFYVQILILRRPQDGSFT